MRGSTKVSNFFKSFVAWSNINTRLFVGPSKLRLEVPPPSIDRFYGEQIIAFLIISDYLREDFHYTAYSTISYIQRGPQAIQDDELEFQPAPIMSLPPMKELKDFLVAMNEKEDVSFVQETKSPEKQAGKKRRILSSSSDDDSDNNKLLSTSFKNSELDRLIEKKVEYKLRKILGENEAGASTSTRRKSEDVVVVTPKKEEIIVID